VRLEAPPTYCHVCLATIPYAAGNQPVNCRCGVQARASFMALVETLPKLREVRCHDLRPAATEAFIREMSGRFGRLKFTPCTTPAEMARGADVIVSAIPIVIKPQPPLDAGLLKSGGLAVSLDYDSAWSSAAMKQCDKFVTDDAAQLLAAREHGPYFSGIPQRIHADLGELSAGLKKGRESPAERIFSMNMGIAVDDMVTAKALYERALARKVGVRLPV